MSKLVFASLLSMGAVLHDCAAFRRFEQLSFSCTSALTGPFELRVIDRSVGDRVTLSRPSGEQQLPIAKTSQDMLILSTPPILWMIDLNAKRVFLSQGKQTVLADCQVKSFSM
ncbi:hypothetical protein [Cypionkella sp.]|uniref:hypothetical protein n=1 Tax=Cypionkella sp. TaxID=2811411 RepID=UPI002FDD7A71